MTLTPQPGAPQPPLPALTHSHPGEGELHGLPADLERSALSVFLCRFQTVDPRQHSGKLENLPLSREGGWAGWERGLGGARLGGEGDYA